MQADLLLYFSASKLLCSMCCFHFLVVEEVFLNTIRKLYISLALHELFVLLPVRTKRV